MNRKISELFLRLPCFIQDLAVTAYDIKSYRLRRTGEYQQVRRYLEDMEGRGVDSLRIEQENRLREFLRYVSGRSRWFAGDPARRLSDFPVLTKDDLVGHLDSIATIRASEGIVSHTGGTTGASLKVYYYPRDVQERAAFLDHFRARYGYELGMSTAWFSGKAIATPTDVRNGRCYRDDFVHRIRYFSTFHINGDTARLYWEKLGEFAPDYVVGFPSSVYQICRAALERGERLVKPVVAYFPTAETMLPIYRDVISEALGCQVRDQYASSEGAPFVFECPEGRMHMHPLSGIFEVVDSDLRPAQEGELLVTSFSTRGTPLIRYRIGDRVRLAPKDERCPCGSAHPVAAAIEGRTSDYVWSPTSGRINLGNLSNCTKGISGIRRFQVVQDQPGAILVKVAATEAFDPKQELAFVDALRARTGEGMEIRLQRVAEIPVAASGKFRIVINNVRQQG